MLFYPVEAVVTATVVQPPCNSEFSFSRSGPHPLLPLPEMFRDGVPAAATQGADSALKPFRMELNRLRVLLLLDASEAIAKSVTTLEADLDDAISTDWKTAMEEEGNKPPDQRMGVYRTFDTIFNQRVTPSVRHLASLMAKELD